ncbi:MAG: hypothetical protein Q7K55_06280 [Candidatus Levybacteria bacterium]|nr:hypothetical protein [Candidatus Levybacteria bacterium]
MDRKKMMDHLKDHHIDYPATAEEIKMACEDMSEFSSDEKKWFSDSLPKGTYDSPEDVLMALGKYERTAGSYM